LASFALHFMGLVVSDWKRFELLQVTDVVGQVSELLKQQNCDTSSVKQAYVRMLSGLLKHDPGYKWILQTGEITILPSTVIVILQFHVLACMNVDHTHYISYKVLTALVIFNPHITKLKLIEC